MNSRLLERKIEKHKIQKIGCDGEPRADENWMSAETSWLLAMFKFSKLSTKYWPGHGVANSQGDRHNTSKYKVRRELF